MATAGQAAAGAIAAFGPLRRGARCWRGWEVGGREGWSRGSCARPRRCRGLGVKLPSGTWRRDQWAVRACRWLPGARNQAGCGKPGAPPRSGRELPQRLGDSREEGAAWWARGSRRPSSSRPRPARGGSADRRCRAPGPALGPAGDSAPAPEPGTANPSLPLVTFRFKSASQNVFTAPAGGPGWRRRLAKPGEVSLGRDYRTLCAGLGAGGRQCSPESWGHVGEISYSFSR